VFSWQTDLTPVKTVHGDTLADSKFTPTPGIMGPTAIDWNSVPAKTNATGWTRQFFNSPIATAATFECHATTVNPGQSTHAPSTHPDDREEAIVVQSGTVEAYVKGDWKRLGPGGVVFNAAHEMQAIRNAGDTPATYFVLMWQTHGPAT
jgi:quercetin dioxygenase-like cupin family protein